MSWLSTHPRWSALLVALAMVAAACDSTPSSSVVSPSPVAASPPTAIPRVPGVYVRDRDGAWVSLPSYSYDALTGTGYLGTDTPDFLDRLPLVPMGETSMLIVRMRSLDTTRLFWGRTRRNDGRSRWQALIDETRPVAITFEVEDVYRVPVENRRGFHALVAREGQWGARAWFFETIEASHIDRRREELVRVGSRDRTEFSDRSVAVVGAVSKEAIGEVVRAHIGELRDCYRRGLTRQPQLQGRVNVRFNISASGAAENASPAGAGPADAAWGAEGSAVPDAGLVCRKPSEGGDSRVQRTAVPRP